LLQLSVGSTLHTCSLLHHLAAALLHAHHDCCPPAPVPHALKASHPCTPPPRSYPPSPSLSLLTPSCRSLCCCFVSKLACISLASRQCCCLVLLCLAACWAVARRCCRYMLGCCCHPSCSKPSWLLLPSRPGCHRRCLPPLCS
jgi:hypothetical protein